MDSQTTSLLINFFAGGLLLFGVVRVLRTHVVARPILVGVAVGLATGLVVVFDVAKELGMLTLAGVLTVWAVYLVVWVLICSVAAWLSSAMSDAA